MLSWPHTGFKRSGIQVEDYIFNKFFCAATAILARIPAWDFPTSTAADRVGYRPFDLTRRS